MLMCAMLMVPSIHYRPAKVLISKQVKHRHKHRKAAAVAARGHAARGSTPVIEVRCPFGLLFVCIVRLVHLGAGLGGGGRV